MARYQLKAVAAADGGNQELQKVKSSLASRATAEQRQEAIEILSPTHEMNLSTTKSLRYDADFKRRDGMNTNGNIRIGPSAFARDRPWLANVVFHEIVHSDQFQFYAQQGIDFSRLNEKDEPVRVLIALDEYEGFYWSWRNRTAFGLSDDHAAELARELRLWQIEIDDGPTVAFVRGAKFRDARLALLERVNAGVK